MTTGTLRCFRRTLAAVIIGLAALAAFSAFAQPKADGERGKADKKAASNRIVIDRVVAVVNDAVILRSDVSARMLPLAANLRNIADSRERLRREKKLTSQILEDMIAEELIVQAAKEAKLKVEDKEVAAAIEEIKKQNKLGKAELEQALEMQGHTMTSYKKDVERQILRMRSINMLVRPKVTITDEDVRARYDEMSRRSAAVSKVHLQHVLIALPSKSTEQQVAAAKAKAAEVITRFKNGEPFGDLARQYSDDQATRTSSGDLGWIERGSLPTEWEVIVFAMDKNEIRGPISGPRGLHVFHVKDLKKSDLASFKELKEQLRNELYRKEMDRQTKLWLDDLKGKAHIERKL